MWFNGYDTLTYNRLFNFVLGARGTGKSYWGKDWAIKDFKKGENNQFIYLRRYDTELDDIDTYFKDIKEKYPDDDLQVKSNEFFINGKQAGYAFPLSIADSLKSNSFPHVNKIIYDEFIIDKKRFHHYLNDEVMQFLDFYETVNRLRIDGRKDVIVFFFANSISFINPYTLFFDLKLPYGKNIITKGDLLLQLVQDNEFIQKKKESRFGKIIAGTRYEDYAINNKFLRDDNTFIEKKTGDNKYLFGLKYKGKIYGIWINYGLGKIYVSEDYDKNYKIVYSTTLDDHSPNTMLLKRLNASPHFKQLLEEYQKGNVYFENMKIKNVIYDIIKMTNS